MKQKTRSSEKYGTCKLTGLHGKFVDSHIIPRGLTEQTWRGQPLHQEGPHGRLIRRWTSWYDSKLVTSAGEKVLSEYDTWGIELLRRHSLTWSSWGLALRLSASDHTERPDGSAGFRVIQKVDTDRLRIFLLSILWRAAASDLPEMQAVRLSLDELEKLRIMVLYALPMPYDFFPIQLTQLSTRNFPHNQAPYQYSHVLKTPGWFFGYPKKTRERKHFRFWMDGLTVHFYMNEPSKFVDKMLFFVGKSTVLRLLTIPAERSRQMKQFWAKDYNRVLGPEELAKIRDSLHHTE